MSHRAHPLVARNSRAALIRALLNGLRNIPQISHPKTGAGVRTRFDHTRNMCQLARLLHAHFKDSASPLWPQLCLRLACHDIGHTPYGHAGERVVQTRYDPGFSNSAQSHRYMYAGTDGWPEGVTPFAWCRSAPIQKLSPAHERDLAALVEFFDDLENAIGDAIDLHTLGHTATFEFLNESCSWSGDVRIRPGETLPHFLKRIVLHEFAPGGFGDLADRASDDKQGCLNSVDQLRDLISDERPKCTRIGEIDSIADSRIPLLFDQASDYLNKRFSGRCDDGFVRQVAIDMVASTDELELT